MSQIWEINGLSLELDIEDYETAEKYKTAFETMSKEEKKLQKDGYLCDFIKNYCQLYWNLFDSLFGSGTAEKIFDNKYNSRICEEVYVDFLNFVQRQRVDAAERRNNLLTQFAPQNRAARRSKK